jgi:hypothetical protein
MALHGNSHWTCGLKNAHVRLSKGRLSFSTGFSNGRIGMLEINGDHLQPTTQPTKIVFFNDL